MEVGFDHTSELLGKVRALDWSISHLGQIQEVLHEGVEVIDLELLFFVWTSPINFFEMKYEELHELGRLGLFVFYSIKRSLS